MFIEDPNTGTATLTGHLESTLHPGYGFDVNLTFTGRTTDPSAGGGPHLELDPGCYVSGGGSVNPSTWHFYTNFSGTLAGTGNYAGAALQVTPFMHFFQVGPDAGSGASGKNVNPGASGWFTWTVLQQPNGPQFHLRSSSELNNRSGDLNFNCDNSRRPDCHGSIGDFVWQDDNGNGCQDAGEPGIPNVQVDLYRGCGANREFVETKFTDQDGKYLFTDLCAGDYSVSFHTPAGYEHTLANQSCNVDGKPADETDSDCECTGTSSPCDICVNLSTDDSTDLTIDCGYVSPCALSVEKSCIVPVPSPTPFNCSQMKPIDTLVMIWNGSQTIDIKAWKGAVGSTLLSNQTGIAPGQTVTVNGFAGAPNDVIWEIFDHGTGTKLGNSDFHLSCSDADMNGPEDCGKAEGDAKGQSGFINQWIFAGMSGNGVTIDCGASQEPSASCTIAPGPLASCSTVGKPTSLTFQYTGGGCGASNNPQAGKFSCSGSVDTAQPITVSSGNGYGLSNTTVAPGGTFTVSAGSFRAQSSFTLSNSGGTESLSIHTSCSQTLEVGNVFGDLTLVAFNGQTGGASIVYHYTVKNSGSFTLNNVFLTDDQLGSIAGPFSLNAGEIKTFDVQIQLDQTTTNTATAYVQNQNCSATSGAVTVTVAAAPSPTPAPQTENCTTHGKPNMLTFTYTGGSCASSVNSQGPPNFKACTKFCCSESNGGLTGASSVRIIVSGSSSTPTAKSQRYFDGAVALNGAFDVSAGSGKKASFKANTFLFVYEGGVLKQKVQIHTSCSAPLVRGETFGGVRLDDYSN